MKTKKLITGIVVGGLTAGLLIGALGYLSKGFKDWDAKKWFDKPTITTPTTPDVPPVAPVEMPKAHIMRKIGDKVNVKVTVEPVTATDQRITWTSSDPTKIVVTPTSAMSNVASIECKALFDGHITITASTVTGGFSKTCDVTFSIRPTSLTIKDGATALTSTTHVDYAVGTTKTYKVELAPDNVKPMFKKFAVSLSYDMSKETRDRFTNLSVADDQPSLGNLMEPINPKLSQLASVTTDLANMSFTIVYNKTVAQVMANEQTSYSPSWKYNIKVSVYVVDDGTIGHVGSSFDFDVTQPVTDITIDKPSLVF